jgi:hypothetical protein
MALFISSSVGFQLLDLEGGLRIGLGNSSQKQQAPSNRFFVRLLLYTWASGALRLDRGGSRKPIIWLE